MERDEHLLSRRSVVLTGIAGASSLAGCMDGITDPTGGDGEPDETVARITEGDWATGDVPLVRLAARSEGWVGQGPEEVTDETNPPLRFEAG